jgi:hypothetical protein
MANNAVYTNMDAFLSADGAYRYALTRRWEEWGEDTRSFIVIGLNPSTADASQDDPTIRRCVSFARREGCNQLVMLNLFAFRATNPRRLAFCPDPVGPENYNMLWSALRGDQRRLVVAAWGTHGHMLEQDDKFISMVLANGIALYRFGKTTRDGHPRHPLYVPGNEPLVRHA